MKSSIAGIVEEEEKEDEENKNSPEILSPGLVLKQNEVKRLSNPKET